MPSHPLQQFIARFQHEELATFTTGYVYGAAITDFVKYAYAHGLVPKDYDLVTDAWQAAKDKEAFIATAPIEDVKRLIGLHIREDRFCEGALLCSIESGLITQLLQRVIVLSNL